MGIIFIDYLVENLSQSLHTSTAQINFVVCMLLSYVLGFINRFILSSNARMIFSLLSGMLLQYQAFGLGMLHIVLATLNTYLFIKYFGRRYSAFYIIIFNIIHLSYLQLEVMFNSYGNWVLGVETAYMMSICKFSSIAFNYEDGEKDEKELKSSYYRLNAIKEKPSLLETFSYIFFYPTCLVGPSFEFRDFQRFINLEGEYKNLPYNKCNKSARDNLIWAFIFATLLVLYADASNPNYCGTEEFANRSWLFKCAYVYFSILILRSRYYTGWKLCQGSVDFSGLGYTEKVNKEGKLESSFDKIDVCNLTVMEFSINPRIKLQYWNRSVHIWLKYHLYLRMVNTKLFEKKKGLASLITFFVSAIWHGFYLNYYLFFFQYYFIEQITSFLEEKYDLFNKIDKSNFLIKFFAWNLVMCTLIYFGNTFTLLSTTLTYNYYKAFNFIPNILLLLVFMYVTVFSKKKKKIEKLSTD